MSETMFSRSAMLLGENAETLLKSKHVALFGVGGVGGNAAETLARSGIGHIHVVDSDTVSVSNLNRQTVAAKSTIGQRKIDVIERRLLDISDCQVTKSDLFVLPENIDIAVPNGTDVIIDAIDTVAAKLALIKYAKANGILMVSCMGMGNRLDPTQIRVGDIFDVTDCHLARAMRRELRKANIDSLNVVYSLETPMRPKLFESENEGRTPGSVAFVPSVAGIVMAGWVVKSLLSM